MSVVKKAQKQAEKEARRARMYPRAAESEVAAVVGVLLPDLNYRELQAKAKELGLKASGSKESILDSIILAQGS